MERHEIGEAEQKETSYFVWVIYDKTQWYQMLIFLP